MFEAYLIGAISFLLLIVSVSWLQNAIGTSVLCVGSSKNKSFGKMSSKKKMLHGPISFPLIGSAIQVSILAHKKKNFELAETLCKYYKSPVLGFYGGLQYFVLVEDFETAKEILSSDEWTGRVPAHPMYYDYSLFKNYGVLPGHSEMQKESRRFVIKSLVEFGFGEIKTMDYCLQYELDEFLTNFEVARAEAENHNNSVMSMDKRFYFSALNILWKVMCGTRFSSDNDGEMKQLVQFLKETSSLVSVGTQPLYAFPFLRFIPGLTHHQLVCAAYEKCQGVFKKIVDERLRTERYKTEAQDFIDLFLQQIEQTKDNPSDVYSYDNLIQCCVDLLNTGVDTTPNTLEFAMLFMIKNPEIQRKVQEEIDHVIEKGRIPISSDRGRMPYTEAVLLEVLRHKPVLPIIPRSAINGATLNGCEIPKNAFAGVNVLRINKDPKIWPNPDAFDPTRFLDPETGLLLKDNKLLTFGGGKRTCLGLSMAKVTLFTFFTSLLQRYNFELCPNVEEPSLECVLSGITIGPQPYQCIVKRRD